MKVTMFIGSLTGGGAERVLCNLASFLVRNRHEVCIITNVEGAAAYELDERVGRYVLLYNKDRKNGIFNFLHCMKRLKEYVRDNATDQYVVFLPLTTVMLLALRKKIKGPIIASERGDPKKNTKLMKNLLSRWIHRADRVVFQTEEAKSWYEPYLKGAETVVIPNAINSAFIRPKFEGEREKTIVGAGRFNEQKNFPLLIRAFAKLAEKYPDHQLVIYGKGGLQESYERLAQELGVAHRVVFPGYVPDMPAQLEKAGMFVLSSDYEGMPNALMEAMASGLPCVSTDCGGGGARFLIKDGENGLLVPIGDETAMAQAMERVLSDETLATTLGDNARKLQETLAPEKIYGAWERVIEKTVE